MKMIYLADMLLIYYMKTSNVFVLRFAFIMMAKIISPVVQNSQFMIQYWSMSLLNLVAVWQCKFAESTCWLYY